TGELITTRVLEHDFVDQVETTRRMVHGEAPDAGLFIGVVGNGDDVSSRMLEGRAAERSKARASRARVIDVSAVADFRSILHGFVDPNPRTDSVTLSRDHHETTRLDGHCGFRTHGRSENLTNDGMRGAAHVDDEERGVSLTGHEGERNAREGTGSAPLGLHTTGVRTPIRVGARSQGA